MSMLFDPFELGPLEVKNRFVRSATAESMSDRKGMVKDSIVPMYEGLSAGGTGLIISGHMYVHEDWKCSPCQVGCWSDEHLPGLGRIARASSDNGAEGCAQINYATRLPAEMSREDIVEAKDCFVRTLV